jgi:hypothetical protein
MMTKHVAINGHVVSMHQLRMRTRGHSANFFFKRFFVKAHAEDGQVKKVSLR